MERMTQEMTDLKKRWFESKKREQVRSQMDAGKVNGALSTKRCPSGIAAALQVDRERQSKTVAIGKVPGSLAATTGFVGGGFALSLTQQG